MKNKYALYTTININYNIYEDEEDGNGVEQACTRVKVYFYSPEGIKYFLKALEDHPFNFFTKKEEEAGFYTDIMYLDEESGYGFIPYEEVTFYFGYEDEFSPWNEEEPLVFSFEDEDGNELDDKTEKVKAVAGYIDIFTALRKYNVNFELEIENLSEKDVKKGLEYLKEKETNISMLKLKAVEYLELLKDYTKIKDIKKEKIKEIFN